MLQVLFTPVRQTLALNILRLPDKVAGCVLQGSRAHCGDCEIPEILLGSELYGVAAIPPEWTHDMTHVLRLSKVPQHSALINFIRLTVLGKAPENS